MCEEKCRLVNEYVAAAMSLSRAAIKLRGLHWEELTQARMESDAARTLCDRAREALLRHETDHEGCSGPLSRRQEVLAAHG
jgi:hypothetical protein